MTSRSRSLISLLVVALALPASPTLGQDADVDGSPGSFGDMVSSGVESVVGSLADLAAGIDPSDPDGEVDPASPDDGDDVPSGDIDPSDPDANPGDPIEPTEPDDTTPDGDGDGGIELPEPSEPEEGGFREIQLLPDPAPLPGAWKVVNHAGRMTCTAIGTIALKKSEQRTNLKVLQDGRILQGPRLAQGARKVKVTWQPESERYTGVVEVAAPGGKTKIRFYLEVVGPRKLKGRMVATVNVNSRGVSGSCRGSRKITLTHR